MCFQREDWKLTSRTILEDPLADSRQVFIDSFSWVTTIVALCRKLSWARMNTSQTYRGLKWTTWPQRIDIDYHFFSSRRTKGHGLSSLTGEIPKQYPQHTSQFPISKRKGLLDNISKLCRGARPYALGLNWGQSRDKKDKRLHSWSII